MVPGGPTDDDGWGDAAEELPTRRPTIAAWDDDEAEAEAEAGTEAETGTAAEAETAAEAAAEAETEAETEAEAEAEPVATVVVAEVEVPDADADADPVADADAVSDPAPDEPWKGSLAEAAGIDVPPPRPPRPPLLSRRGWFYLIAALVVAALLTAGGIASHLNSQRLYLVCGDDDVRAERGRWFPWGRTALDGDRWKPFELPGTCESRELDSESELEAAFLELLVNRLNGMLAAEQPGDIAAAEALIDQGMSLSRSPEHKTRRTELERLRGDVEYWRGRGEVTSAIERLEQARTHVDEAVKIGPRHAPDAREWMGFIERLIERAKRGPGPEPEPAAPHIDAATPAAPTADAAPPAVPIVIPDAGPTPAPTPDAGAPRGGVLL